MPGGALALGLEVAQLLLDRRLPSFSSVGDVDEHAAHLHRGEHARERHLDVAHERVEPLGREARLEARRAARSGDLGVAARRSVAARSTSSSSNVGCGPRVLRAPSSKRASETPSSRRASSFSAFGDSGSSRYAATCVSKTRPDERQPVARRARSTPASGRGRPSRRAGRRGAARGRCAHALPRRAAPGSRGSGARAARSSPRPASLARATPTSCAAHRVGARRLDARGRRCPRFARRRRRRARAPPRRGRTRARAVRRRDARVAASRLGRRAPRCAAPRDLLERSSCRVNSSSVKSARSSSTSRPAPEQLALVPRRCGAVASSVTSFCDMRASASCSRSALAELGLRDLVEVRVDAVERTRTA